MIQKSDDRNQKSDGAPVKSFEDLRVFQRAYAISLDVHRASLGWPQMEQFALADQVRRASKSVCANIAEGFGRQRGSGAEFRRFLRMAVGSCDEMQVWAHYAWDLGCLTEQEGVKWKREYVEIAKMLRALSDSWK
ncbi:MAG TPA: four helix bundle protein [Vitreimonas sp.]|uniref:four helix bundle protein n=1 Tax=Vitreimonas sp. TaxID=3069702 RepID=UPI002D555CD0|nr:four helix bundle protein [Vitreimonas sp.]HYD89217.1 four helix bundle protein [Vitreimonas sp.]